ncbi:MAG: hypothetical protein EXR27_04390 [Betaproteobacteria bacterium]|nr:hypothetical protein [Betaproteobacteria bacterium]
MHAGSQAQRYSPACFGLGSLGEHLGDSGVRSRGGNPGDVAPVGEGVSELRLHFGSAWRVYYTERKRQLVILLAGGGKDTQSKDIKLALNLARNL